MIFLATFSAWSEVALLAVPTMRVSRSDEDLAYIANGSQKNLTRDKNRRSRDKRIQAARRQKRDDMLGNVSRGGSGAAGADLASTSLIGYGSRYQHGTAESSDPTDERAELPPFPDAQLKLSFPHIKNKLQERLAHRHAHASMESHHKGRTALDDSSDLGEMRSEEFKTESFWLELRARVYGTDLRIAHTFVREQRARLPKLVESVVDSPPAA